MEFDEGNVEDVALGAQADKNWFAAAKAGAILYKIGKNDDEAAAAPLQAKAHRVEATAIGASFQRPGIQLQPLQPAITLRDKARPTSLPPIAAALACNRCGQNATHVCLQCPESRQWFCANDECWSKEHGTPAEQAVDTPSSWSHVAEPLRKVGAALRRVPPS